MDNEVKNEVKILENLAPEKVFSDGGASEILSAIREKALNFEADVLTKQGRDKIASQAYSVSKSKKFLEKAATELKSDWKKKTDVVNSELRAVKTTLDDLRDEVRQPLTEYEKKQEEEEAKAEAKRLAIIKEEEDRAAKAEEDRLQKIYEDQEKIRIKQEEAQTKIDKANEELERKQAEAQAKIDAENQKIEDEKRKIQDEKDAIEQAKIDEENKKIEIENAKQQAIEDERQKVAEEKRVAEELAEDKRIKEEKAKSKKKHIDKIESEAIDDIQGAYSVAESLEDVLSAIKLNQIRHITINY